MSKNLRRNKDPQLLKELAKIPNEELNIADIFLSVYSEVKTRIYDTIGVAFSWRCRLKPKPFIFIYKKRRVIGDDNFE